MCSYFKFPLPACAPAAAHSSNSQTLKISLLSLFFFAFAGHKIERDLPFSLTLFMLQTFVQAKGCVIYSFAAAAAVTASPATVQSRFSHAIEFNYLYLSVSVKTFNKFSFSF